MNTVYNVDYFIKKFEAIPEEKIINYELNDTKGNHCANGWCMINLNGEVNALGFLFTGRRKYSTKVASINNGNDRRYQQPTPKQRILAALWDIKKLSYPELSETTVNDLIMEKEMNDL